MAGNIRIIEPTDNYQKVSKGVIFDKEIDALTLGIYVKVLCLGKEWELNVQGLAKTLNLSEAKIKAAFSRLERAGYVKRIHVKDEKTGYFLGFDYHIGHDPFPENERTDLVTTHGRNESNHPKIQRMDNPTDGKSNRRKIQPMEKMGDIYRDNNKDRDIKKKIEIKFTPPTPQDVVAYCKEQGFADPEGFADYYLRCQKEMQWRTKSGKQITNWKLNVQQWRKYHQNEHFPRKGAASLHQTTKHSFQDFIER